MKNLPWRGFPEQRFHVPSTICTKLATLAEAEKAQIAVEGADHLYREIRVDNELQDENGKTVSLKPGAHVEVTIEAEREATRPAKLRDQERFF